MRRAGASLLILMVLAFIASLTARALRPTAPAAPPMPPEDPLLGTATTVVDVPGLFLRPDSHVLLALTAAVFAALAFHALRRALAVRRLRIAESAIPRSTARRLAAGAAGPLPPGQMVQDHSADDSLLEHAPLILALGLGAVWPWMIERFPLTSFLMAALMLAGFLAAALRGLRQAGHIRKSKALSFVAGWATLVTLEVFIGLLQMRLGVPLVLASTVGMVLVALATVGVQLRLGRSISYSVAVIWGLIGLVVATVTVNVAVATLAVLAIAVIVFGLVQVTT